MALVPGLSVDAVKSMLGIRPADARDDAWLGTVTAAIDAYVARMCADRLSADDTTAGAILLAAALYQRRNSAQGIAAFPDLGEIAYVSRTDPDVDRLLRIGYAATVRSRIG